ncbi:low molecular weight protein-tyrosine-phosphatase [Salisediminibacterium halotolerans]|uniref:low molecular weight protein-tyrosine-phosphatase n=1 Tax=Salisediminibacterium halotolerans TaxID=517425 RepID=UPI000EADCDEC|nr:low molecular weight protein-tyrosine-phosphatase [Salisediminibacterium halotolerans]RLJ78028.1 protein-tyrosine phosphatase [Actinophytocola xinjiangensis]RPE88634.1 protein-tyrosine phosphatase [Salisediminibacterium halotolerans]TWG37005.1 protein-tyrosine phosphatase [Salisediminibacterium halotolerans]GEL08785.1 phosphotyrosine protein phosphatase [Salisediminibacterium halotolerans]
MVKVLFVCLGNICRSPMAEAIFRDKLKEEGLEDKIFVDSAGTGSWHVNKPPHEGTIKVLKKYQIDPGHLRGRQVSREDLTTFDYIISMDGKNASHLQNLQGAEQSAALYQLLDFASKHQGDVPDPFFTGNFDEVYDMIADAANGLLTYIKEKERI